MATPLSKTFFLISKPTIDALDTALASIDRGCSLTKAVYISKAGEGDTDTHYALHCVTFPNTAFKDCLNFLNEHAILKKDGTIRITGAGSDANSVVIKNILNLEPVFIREGLSYARGLHFLLSKIQDPAAAFCPSIEEPVNPGVPRSVGVQKVFQTLLARNTRNNGPDPNAVYPCIFIIIGSGTVANLVESDGKCRLLKVSFVGGRSLLGLGKALVGTNDYDEIMELASKGDCASVDLVSADLFDAGTQYRFLPPNATVFPFGKMSGSDKPLESYRREDLAAGLVYMLALQISDICGMSIQQEGVNRVIFGGHGVKHQVIRAALSKTLSWLSDGTVKPKFLRSGEVGAIGSLISQPGDEEKYFMR